MKNMESRDREAYQKTGCTWNRRAVLIIVTMLMGLILAYAVDYEIQNPDLSEKTSICLERINNLSRSFFQSNNGYIMDAFSLIWGMTITLVLFLMEFHNTYWYGVTLRNIVNLSFNKSVLILSAIVYILLCPLVYFAENFNFFVMALWGIICTFFIFIMVPICIFYVTGKNKIIELLNRSTISQMRKKVREENDTSVGIGIFEKYTVTGQSRKKDGIQMELEELSITSMIEHLEYEDIAEIRKLLETLADLFVNWDVLGLIQNTEYEHAVIMFWADKIITKSGTETDYQCKRTLYIVGKLWEEVTESILKITDKCKDTNERETLMMSCLVEILVPLIGQETKQSERVFWGVWKKIRYYRPQVLLYLLLYMEYLHYERINFSFQNSYRLLDKVYLNREELEAECKIWNKDLALEFWLCWTALWSSDCNIAVSFFMDFYRDIENIASGDMSKVRTLTMRRVMLRMED